MIFLQGIKKTYTTGFIPKKVDVLKGLSLKVEQGEVFGFLGPNGAGKTTTIKILMNLINASEGTATIAGINVRDPQARSRVGYLPEQPYFYDYLTGMEVVDYCGRLFRIPAEIRIKRVNELLERVGLHEEKDKPLRKYSRGMLQRVGIAQALINDPELIVLDEPLSGLDPIGRRELIDIIVEQKNLGKTIFFCSHILSDTEAFCDRIGILKEGSLITEGSLQNILGKPEDIKKVDIIFTFSDGKNVNGFKTLGGLRKIGPEHYSLSVAPEVDINATLSKLIASQVQIHSVNRQRHSLEDIFLDKVG